MRPEVWPASGGVTCRYDGLQTAPARTSVDSRARPRGGGCRWLTGSGRKAATRGTLAIGFAAALAAAGLPAVAQIGGFGPAGLGQGFGLPTAAPGAGGGTPGFRTRAFVRGQETFSDNVNLGTVGNRSSDWTTDLSGGVALDWNTPRATLIGTAAAQTLYFARRPEDSRVNPAVSLLGRLEAVPRFFYVEGAVSSGRTYLSPFAPRSLDNTNALGNSYTSTVTRVSPYIQGVAGGNISYLLRNDSTWFDAGGSVPGSYANGTTALVSRTPTPLGWALTYNRTFVDWSDRPRYTADAIRARVVYRAQADLELFAIGGYEWTDYLDVQRNGGIWGGGATWRPTPRTVVSALYEERYYGPSWLIAMDHRRPGFAINVSSVRSQTTTPQTANTAAVGISTAAFLDAAFITRYPDPVARQAAVNDFVLANNLPPVLTSTLQFYSQSVFVRTAHSATFVLLGVQQSIGTTLFYAKNEETRDYGILPAPLGLVPASEQRGISLFLSRRLSPFTTVTGAFTDLRTHALGGSIPDARQDVATLSVRTALTPRSGYFWGGRWQQFSRPDSALGEATERAAFAGFDHRF